MDPMDESVVIAAVDDLFFSARIESVAKGLGIKLIVATDFEKITEQLQSCLPALVILDLNSRACRPIEALRQIKSDPARRSLKTIGFFSHLQVELQKQAKEAGCDQVIARSAFTAKLAELLKL